MRIEVKGKFMTSLFLFAHQDDEFGVFWKIYSLCQTHNRVIIAYLTSGSVSGQQNPTRDQESINVLMRLGVARRDIHFVGASMSIADGRLPEHFGIAFDACMALVKTVNDLAEICSVAWEGGHQDHDACHVVAVIMAKKLRLLERSSQFSLYHGAGLRGSFFRLFAPLPENGEISSMKIPLGARLRFSVYPFIYRSQWKSWIGLYPFMIAHYVFSGNQELQKFSDKRINVVPHGGKLLYERRGSYSRELFFQSATSFIALHG